jgi:hypothetical protein
MIGGFRQLVQIAFVGLAASSQPHGLDSLIEGNATVITSGSTCQMVALDDGRLFTLQEGHLLKKPYPVLSRIRIRALRSKKIRCTSADPLEVITLDYLIDQSGGARGEP